MVVLVAITGGSGSGKSTLAEGLRRALPPGATTLVSEDWYYRDFTAFAGFDPQTFDFDDVAARDHALLADHLRTLKAGGTVDAPVYDFATHARRPDRVHRVAPAPVTIVEGAHLLCADDLADLFDLRVYLDTPADIRFIRRLLRDQAQRGRTAQSVVGQYLGTVRPAYYRLIRPGRARADIVIADPTTTVDEPDMGVIEALARPLLDHPMLSAVARA